MKRIIDLTGDNFFRIRNGWQVIDSYIPRLRPETLELQVWGGVLWLDRCRELGDNFMPAEFGSDDLYISNLGKLTFSGIKGGILEAIPYNNPKTHDDFFAKNTDGSNARYARDWGPQPPNFVQRLEHGDPPGPDGIEEYGFDLEIDWPHSYVDMLLYANGPVTFEFDDSNLIPWEEYEANPEKYKFPNFGK